MCGGLGWALDLLIGTHRVFMGVGMVIGAAVGTYTVYLRYGKEP